MAMLTRPRRKVRPHTRYPANPAVWRDVESSNVKRIGWYKPSGMYVEYLNGGLYYYHGVSRQRAVACANAASVGSYIARKIKPHFVCTRILAGWR